jgi:type IV pilus assembly protein PilC
MLLSLLKGKIGLMDALRILSREGMEREVRESAISLLSVMKKGSSFSEGLRIANNGKISFEPMYLSLITAAEATGSIDGALERIAGDLKRRQAAKENIQGVLVYPCIVIAVAIAGTVFIMAKGLPMFMESGLLREDILRDAASGILFAGAVLLSGGGLLFIVYYRIFYTDSPEYSIFHILDFLLKSSITLTDALSYCILSVKNPKYAKALVMIKKEIAFGVPFSAAFENAKLFPPYVSGWLAVADKNGSIAEICGNISGYYAQKDARLRNVAAKLTEPAIIVLVGIYILVIMLSVVLPMLTYAGGIL